MNEYLKFEIALILQNLIVRVAGWTVESELLVAGDRKEQACLKTKNIQASKVNEQYPFIMPHSPCPHRPLQCWKVQ